MIERLDYETLWKAWEKMKQPTPEQPIVLSPIDYVVAERIGLVKDGRLDRARLWELRREHGV